MIKKSLRFISFIMAVIILLTPTPAIPLHAQEAQALALDVSCPFGSSVVFTLPNGTTTTSTSYRIPSMVTLKDGTIVAAADIRWNTTYDGGGLDTLVARSENGGADWEYTLANYLGDNGNAYNGSSTCFIDPCLTVAADGQTVYMLVDLYPYGVALNGNKETAPLYDVGFNSSGYLKLRYSNSSSYEYYLKDGKIYSTSGTEVTGYTVDGYFNLYKNGTLTSNLFYSDSPYRVARTGFLYLTSSDDGGKSWSEPTLLNLKTSSENVCLVGPGRGITTSDGTMVFPVYSYGGSTESQRMGFIYSSDGVNWERAQSSISWSSEAAVVEIGEGTLRFFYRNGTASLCYVDYNMSAGTWSSYVNTGVATNSNTQLSAITYSKTSDGKQVVLVSCPTGPNAAGSSNNNGAYRLNGRIFTGVVESDGTMTWTEAVNVSGTTAPSADSSAPYTEAEGFFAYSCLTERADGSVAILYENRENAWGTGSSCYYAMNMKAYSSDSLGVDFDESGDDVVIPDEPSSEITEGDITVSASKVTFTDLAVTAAAAPAESYMRNTAAYNVVPETDAGAYNGAADVTVKIPDGWDAEKTFAFVKEADGSVTVLYGTASGGKFSFRAPHMGEMGIFEATAISDVTDVTVIMGLGTTVNSVTVSESDAVGTAGTFTTDNGAVSYTVEHLLGGTVYEKDTDGIDSGDTYLITLNGSYAACTYSSSYNSWWVNSLPLQSVNLNNGSDLSDLYWTITETNGGYYIRNADGEYMTINTKNPRNNNYTVTLSTTPSVCDITPTGSDYMIFADGTSIGLNNAGGSNQTALGWTDANNTPWALYKVGTANDGTKVSFTGRDVTSGTDVALGSTVYTVIVEPKEIGARLGVSIDSTKTLDALSVLGISGDYSVTYTETSDENDIITLNGADITASAIGEAVVTATVTKNATGETVATVVYTVTVSDVVVNSYKNIYVPVNGTATLSGVTGEIYTGLYDDSIADYTVADDGTVTFSGIAEGRTVLVIGDTQIDVFVNPESFGSSADTVKTININIAKIEHCTVYYAINAGELHKIERDGNLINQTYTDGFNIMFFAVPDKGYVLTQISASGSLDQYYSVSNGDRDDGSKSAAWPFMDADQTTVPTSSSDGAWVSGHGYKWSLMQGNMTIEEMRDLFFRARQIGADGTTTFTKNDNGNNLAETNLSFAAEKLPSFEKSILSVNGAPYSEGTVLEFGDVITYQFTITTTHSNATYTDILLKDDRIGYSQAIPDNQINTTGTYTYTANYTVSEDDLDLYTGGKFVNEAKLEYVFKSNYGSGRFDYADTATVSCKIAGIVYYIWQDGLPEEIVENAEDFPIPEIETVTYHDTIIVKPYEGDISYVVMEDGYAVGTWRFMGWQNGDTFYSAGSTLTMPYLDSVEFKGIWEYEAEPTYTVTYQWTNAPVGTTLPTDEFEYYSGQPYTVDGIYVKDFTVDDGSKVWTFSGWRLNGTVVSGEQIMGESDVVLSGRWMSEEKFTELTVSCSGYAEYSTIDPGQTFMFRISGEDVNVTVTLHGEGSVTVTGLRVGESYTVTEISDWSWRYELDQWVFSADGESDVVGNVNGATVSLGESGNRILFTNERTNKYWLDGDSYEVNIFDKGTN